LIDELKQMLRDKKTKSGAAIDPQLAHEIAKHITILNEAAAQPETKKSIKQFRESVAPFFAKLYGARKKLTTECHGGEGKNVKESFATRKEERAQSFKGPDALNAMSVFGVERISHKAPTISDYEPKRTFSTALLQRYASRGS
jgi:hypothetical protein